MEIPSVNGQIISNLFFLAFLTLVNAFFSCTEMAVVSVNKNRMGMLAEKGNKKAKLILKLLEEPTNFLSTIQVAITLSGFFASASAATNFSFVVENWLNPFNIPYTKEISLVLVTVVLSFFTLVFGELVPKRVALQRAESIALFSVKIVYLISKIVLPFIKLLSFSTNLVLKILGVNLENIEEKVSEEEIKSLIEVGQRHGVFNETEKEMITSVLSFDNKIAREIMIPRKNVYSINIDTPLTNYLDELLEEKHSRIPVYQGDKDNIVGILYLKDFIVEARKNGFENVNISSIMKKPYFVLENKNIDVLFKEFQKRKIFMAILVDEYGSFVGIVTMEDIIEEVMGNIQDVYDEEDPLLEKLSEYTYLVDGFYSLNDLNSKLGLKIDNDEFDTISGFVIDLIGRIPEENEKLQVNYKNLSFQILSVKEKCIDKIKMTISPDMVEETSEEEL
ncbi:hemolysin family protein [Fusobacterium perfoetens]|uniref:hemolysin family protein n=1 Tax=Fusobacterium perfoetens TaxID=852 RepID=UPI001F419412|nr:hemolysin family protein [Fusobacterium perfoetens]MCF2613060.1 HlyC/CorC family transporter [Fusobacterium perfoetens]